MAITKGNITALSKLDGPEAQKAQIFHDLGNLDQYEVLGEDIIVAIYAESNVIAQLKGPDGKAVTLYGTDNRTTESRYQGKVGMIVLMGPTAFSYHNNGQAYDGTKPDVGDWVVFWPSDGRELFLRDGKSKGDGVTCRKVHWSSIVMRVTDPRVVH